jgi:hypothetical protein
MAARVIIQPGTPLHGVLTRVAGGQRIVFLTGLSGVGKSLLLQQLALLAHQAGRVVHLLQWDVSRSAFETPEILARYPEVDGATHMAIRKAVGRWVRGGVRRWRDTHPGPEQMLIGEPPLAGNRLIELAQPLPDDAEDLLAGPETLFLVPVPTREVRRAIEAARGRSIARPGHTRESADAPLNVMQDDWREIWLRARAPGPATAGADDDTPSFDPDVYAQVYRRLLRHRRTELVPIDTIMKPPGSVYDLDIVASELAAAPDEVARCMAEVEDQAL